MTIQAGVGFSFLADPVKAALEASDTDLGNSELVRADLALFFCTTPQAQQLQEFSEQISKVTAAKEVAGCTGFGVMAGSRDVEKSTALSVLVISSDRIKGKSFFTTERLSRRAQNPFRPDKAFSEKRYHGQRDWVF